MNSKYNLLKFIYEEHAKEANGVSAELISTISSESDVEFLLRNDLIKSHILFETILLYYPTDCYSNLSSKNLDVVSLEHAYYLRYVKRPTGRVIVESDYEEWLEKNKESLSNCYPKIYKNEKLHALSNELSESELSLIRMVKGYSANYEVSQFIERLEVEIDMCNTYIKMKLNSIKGNSELIEGLKIEYNQMYILEKTIKYLKPYVSLRIKDVL